MLDSSMTADCIREGMMNVIKGSEIISNWPEDAREPAQLVIDKYGEPDEATETLLTWHRVGPWKRVTASRAVYLHKFPVPHWDAVESVLDYHVPVEFITPIVEFDGSVTVRRTAGEVSAQCHDEEANSLALNLMHDIVTGNKSVQQARDYYAKEFLDYRRKLPTPYMNGLILPLEGDPGDPDQRVISEADLEQAKKEGLKSVGKSG
jgi:hypothetical protein